MNETTQDTLEDEEDSPQEEAEEQPLSPFDLAGDWYVVHSYSGYEKRVKANLETRVRSMHLEDKIFDVAIPMEDVIEYKAGKKVTVQRKKFPGTCSFACTSTTTRGTPCATPRASPDSSDPKPSPHRCLAER